jgi:hypothetical protein
MFRFSGEGEPGFEREMIQSFARIHGVEACSPARRQGVGVPLGR